MLCTLTFAVLVVGALGSVRERSGLNERIHGGRDTQIEKHPYQVAVERNSRYWCGGSIIDKYWVLTAAHCFQDYREEWHTIDIRVGSTYMESGGSLHRLTDLAVHPDFNLSCRDDSCNDHDEIYICNYDYDFALIKVETPFEFGDAVQPVSMVTERPPLDAPVVVTGWGWLHHGGPYPTTLQEVEVNMVDSGECSAAYKTFCYEVTDNMFCAGVKEGGQDACGGDSGGPLVYEGKLAGVVSFGSGCGHPGYPGVYADVTAVSSWITSTTEAN